MSNTEHGFNTLAYSHIINAITSSEVTIMLAAGGGQAFSQGFDASKEIYATLTGVSGDTEIIKITDIVGDVLTVERGQDSTIAQSWLSGSIIAQRAAAINFLAFRQKGEGFRTIAFNPNGTSTADYPGEEVRETGLDACSNRWWKSTNGTNWRLIAGAACPGEVYDENGYLQPPPIWPFYLVGGERSGGTGLTQNDAYDPPFDVWETKQPATLARHNGAGSEIGAFGYMINGQHSIFEDDDNQEYDANEDTWALKLSSPSPEKSYTEASTIGDKIYMVAGYESHGPTITHFGDNDEYDRGPNVWTAKTDISPKRRLHGMTEIGSKIYVWNGSTPSYLLDNDEYVVDTWTARTDIPIRYFGAAATQMNGKGYNFYGWSVPGGNTSDCQEYTPPPTDSWTTKVDGPAPNRTSHTAANYDGLGYATGGRAQGFAEFLDTNEEYNPVTNSWTSKLPILLIFGDGRRLSTIMQPANL